jgi:MGT family glycosyltransferase
MPHFGIVCPPITGHINPLAAVGRALIRRGHRVTCFQIGDLATKARREGLEFIALGDQEYAPGTLDTSVARLSQLSGMASLNFAIQCACRISDLTLKHGPEAMVNAGVDALLVDQNEPAAGTVAEHLNLPFISVCTSLPLNREPLIPPPFLGWAYHDSVFAVLRNRIGYAISDRLIAPIQAILNRYRTKWNLPLLRSPDDSFSRLAQMAQMPREFDFPRKALAANFHYLGPWFDSSGSSCPFPFERLNGKSLVYGSLGTLQSKQSHYFEIMAEAATGLDAQLVLSLGGANAGAPRDLPGDAVMVDYAPQLELLSRAAAVITHSGMNTTQQALFFGLPMVAIPLTHDQPAIAARLARTGAGIVLPPGKLNIGNLRRALSEILSPASPHREAARRLQIASRHSGGVERAADIAEQALKGVPLVAI